MAKKEMRSRQLKEIAVKTTLIHTQPATTKLRDKVRSIYAFRAQRGLYFCHRIPCERACAAEQKK